MMIEPLPALGSRGNRCLECWPRRGGHRQWWSSSRRAVFVLTSTPVVYPPSREASTREAVPMPPLNSNETMPVPPPTPPWATGPPTAESNAATALGCGIMAPLHIVEKRVVAFGDDRQRHVVTDADVRILFEVPRHHAVVDASDRERVGEQYRHFHPARFVDPCRAGHLAVSVERPRRYIDLPMPDVGARHYRRDAGARRADSRHELARTGDVGDLARRERPPHP